MDFCYKLSIFGHECNFDSNVRYDIGIIQTSAFNFVHLIAL